MPLGETDNRTLPKAFSVAKAQQAQKEASKHVIQKSLLSKQPHLVAGVDVAYSLNTGMSVGAVVVLDYHSLSLVESETAFVNTMFPYVSTLLSFREIHPAVAAISKLSSQPDVFFVDGHGIMHPRRLGFASHLGLVLDKPTVGVAKHLLTGKLGDFNEDDWALITDRGEIVGAALLTRRGVKPVYVSIGHMVSLESALEVVKHCTPTHRIPEPIRLAHIAATREKRKFKKPIDQNKNV